MIRNTALNRIFLKTLNVALVPLFCILKCFKVNSNKPFQPKKILFIEIWGIGDLIMGGSAFRRMKEAVPDAKIFLLSKEFAREVFKEEYFIDKYFLYDFPWTKFKGKYAFWKWDWKGLFKLIRRLRNEKFDLILDARGDIRNNLLIFMIRAKRSLGYDWTGGGYLLTDPIRIKNDGIHRTDAWDNLLERVGVDNCIGDFKLTVSDEEKEWARNLLDIKGFRKDDLLVGVHPGARTKTRRWPLERFTAITEYLIGKDGVRPVVFIEPDDYGEEISAKIRCVKLKLTLRQFIVITSSLKLLVCNDGGAMHIAAALGVPVIAIFGPTNPVWFGPKGDGHKIFIKDGIKCRPCFDYCKFEMPLCLTGILVSDVKKEIDAKLAILNKNRNV